MVYSLFRIKKKIGYVLKTHLIEPSFLYSCANRHIFFILKDGKDIVYYNVVLFFFFFLKKGKSAYLKKVDI